MNRPLFFLDRWDGNRWTTLYSAPHQIGPNDLRGPDGQYPDAGHPDNMSVFAGVPGCKARVRIDDVTVEEFDWAIIRVNPLDPQSAMKWGWKSLGRHYEAASEKLKEIAGGMSFLG